MATIYFVLYCQIQLTLYNLTKPKFVSTLKRKILSEYLAASLNWGTVGYCVSFLALGFLTFHCGHLGGHFMSFSIRKLTVGIFILLQGYINGTTLHFLHGEASIRKHTPRGHIFFSVVGVLSATLQPIFSTGKSTLSYKTSKEGIF